MHSCIYEGTVRHHRFKPVGHRFEYRLFMMYLDLEELALLMRRRIISSAWFAPASFRRSDHFGYLSSLSDQVGGLIFEQTGVKQRGPIRLLTQLRYFGYYFSPLNLFFCFDQSGKRVETIVAEVQNTPWRERHCYVLSEANRVESDHDRQFTHDKVFHVSPFMPMDVAYRWSISSPTEVLRVGIDNVQGDETLFYASMSLRRRPLSRWQMWRALLQYPVMTLKISAAIYLQAFRLWRKQCPFYPHPKHIRTNVPTTLQSETPGNSFRTAAS